MKPNLYKNLKIQQNPLFELLNIEKNLDPEILNHFQELIDSGIANKNLSDHLNIHSNLKFELMLAAQFFREQYIQDYGFILLNEQFIHDLSDLLHDKKCLDIGAGTGFLSSILQQKSIDITPIELKINNNNYGFDKTHTSIMEIDAIKYIKSNDNYSHVILSWPNLGSDFAYNVLNELPKGKSLIYMGEHEGGCCANEKFFELLTEKAKIDEEATHKLNSSFSSWPGLHDACFVYKIK